MKAENTINRVATYLAGMPQFIKGEYAIYANVNPKCITRDGKSLQLSNPNGCLDLLICRGNTPLLQIDCTGEECSGSLMECPPRFCLSVADNMELAEFDEDPEYPSLIYLSSFWEDIEQWLERKRSGRHSSLYAMRRQANGQPPLEYTLPAIPAETILPGSDGDAFQQTLIKKRMLNLQGYPTAYARHCGLFLRYWMDASGQVQRELMTAVPVAHSLARTLEAKYSVPAATAVLPLAQRLSRLRKNLPSTDRYAVTVLEELLQTPLEILLSGKSSTLQNVQKALAEVSEHLRMRGIPEVKKEFVSYRDCLELLFQLWPLLGENPRTDSWGDSRLRKNCETILLGMSEPFLVKGPEHQDEPRPPMPAGQNLAQRIRRVNTDPGKPPVTMLPTIHYFAAAACIVGSDYPNWLYQKHFKELVSCKEGPESTFYVIIMVQYCYESYVDNSVDNWEEVFPLLYNLWVEPFSGMFVKTQSTEPIRKER